MTDTPESRNEGRFSDNPIDHGDGEQMLRAFEQVTATVFTPEERSGFQDAVDRARAAHPLEPNLIDPSSDNALFNSEQRNREQSAGGMNMHANENHTASFRSTDAVMNSFWEHFETPAAYFVSQPITELQPTEERHKVLRVVSTESLAVVDKCCCICQEPIEPSENDSELPNVHTSFENVECDTSSDVVPGSHEDTHPASMPLKNVKHIAMQLPCTHIFGATCVRHWLAVKTTCPMCRKEVFPNPRHSADGRLTAHWIRVAVESAGFPPRLALSRSNHRPITRSVGERRRYREDGEDHRNAYGLDRQGNNAFNNNLHGHERNRAADAEEITPDWDAIIGNNHNPSSSATLGASTRVESSFRSQDELMNHIRTQLWNEVSRRINPRELLGGGGRDNISYFGDYGES